MKNSPFETKCKKKRKSQRKLCNFKNAEIAYNNFKNAVSNPRNLRPCISSSIKNALSHLNYKFKVTRAVKRKLHAIKRTIANDSITQIQNLNRIPISDRIRSRGSPTTSERFDLECSQKFLEGRVFTMANSSKNSTNSNESFPKVTITFEQMLNIRKKRLEKKHQRSSLSSDSVVGIVDQTIATEQNDCLEVICIEGANQNQDIIEIKDDSNIIVDCENNNTKKSCEIKHYVDQTEEIKDVEIKQFDCTNLTPEVSSNVERIDHNISHEVVKSTDQNCDFIPLEPFTINDSVVPATISETPSDEIPNNVLADDISNQSVIIVTPSQNDIPKPQIVTARRRTRWSSDNSVIAISDTSGLCQDASDNDIVFVSEECQSTPSFAKRRRLNPKVSLVIIEDDDNRQHVSNQNKKNARKRKYKKKKRGCCATRTSLRCANRSELASCADVNCINSPNRNQALTLCACQQSKTACSLKPYPLTIPEKSATIAQHNHDSCGSGSNWCLLNHSLRLDNVDNKFGSNIHNAGHVIREGLRQIVIDGSNIALGHSNGRVFSVKGLLIAIDYFSKKGHKVTAFVPQYRVKVGQSTNPNLLQKLIDGRLVILTPSREVKGRRITPYDDRYIIQYATTCEGIVVSNDNYRDLLEEKPEWRQTIERRLLMYTWVDDILIFPEDPLGRHGPTLSRFLRFP